MKKLIILSLIITSLFVISCKGSGSSSSSSTTTTTTNTPLQGTWFNSADNETLVFNGSTFSDTSVLSTSPVKSITVAGTFRLDNGNIKVTINSFAGVNGTNTYNTKADVETNLLGGATIPYTAGTEENFGAYAISGTTLTITRPGSSTPDTYTKQ